MLFQGCAPLEEIGQPGAPGMPINSPVSACDPGDPPGRTSAPTRWVVRAETPALHPGAQSGWPAEVRCECQLSAGHTCRDGLGTDTQFWVARPPLLGRVGHARLAVKANAQSEYYFFNGRDPRRRKGRRGSGLNFLYTTALFRASGLAATSGSRSERGLPRPHMQTSTFRSRRDPALRYCLRAVHLSRTLLLHTLLTIEKIQRIHDNVYPRHCRYFPVSGGDIGNSGNGNSSVILLAGLPD